MVRRSSPAQPEMERLLGLSTPQHQHWVAFKTCLTVADRYIRDHAALREVGTVVAEDVPEMRKALKVLPKMLPHHPQILGPGHVNPTVAEQQQGYIVQKTDFRITRIRTSIHFVDKEDDPLLQLADACAFGFRRYFSEQTHGKDFVYEILGKELPLEDYSGGMSGKMFFPHRPAAPTSTRPEFFG